MLTNHGSEFSLHDTPLLGFSIAPRDDRLRCTARDNGDGNSAINPTAATDGFYDTSPMSSFGQYDWVQRRGKTDTQGMVVKVRPWLNLNYNQANSFVPGSLAYDIYGQPLPDPQGETKDYGFQLQLWDGRVTIRATQYETIDGGRGSSEINTLVQRAIRLDADGNGTGGDPDLEGFLLAELAKANPTLTGAPLEAEVSRLMGVDPNFIDSHRNRTHGDGSDQTSRGKEIEITMNPSRYWTLRGSITQTKAFNATMSPKLQEYINNRLATWTSIRSPFDGSPFWNGTYRAGTPPAQRPQHFRRRPTPGDRGESGRLTVGLSDYRSATIHPVGDVQLVSWFEVAQGVRRLGLAWHGPSRPCSSSHGRDARG